MSPRPTNTVELSDNLYWISGCYDMEEKHHQVSVYLFAGAGESLLIDSGSIIHTDGFIDEIERLTDGRGPDTVVLTHQDLPHTGNVRSFRENWNFDLYASFKGSSFSPELVGMGESTSVGMGDRFDVGDRTLEIANPMPPLSDAGHEISVYDPGSGTYFVADGFGHYHDPDECAAVWDDDRMHVSVEDMAEYYLDSLPWIHFVAPETVRAKTERLFESYDIECLAPIHGNPVKGRRALDVYRDRFHESMVALADGQEFETYAH
jgi:flavorubredoxin